MDLERVEAILKLLQRQDHVGTLAVEGEGWRIQARRGAVLPVMPLTEPGAEEDAAAAPDRQVVRALAVGIYRSPGASLRVGDYVEEGKDLGDIDSMRILNAVTSEHAGFVAEALVEDGDAVEYGQELFVLSAAPAAEDGR